MITALIILAFTAFLALNYRLTLRKYTLKSKKIKDDVRLAFISDLHSCRYGKDQSTLIRFIDAQKPDAVLMAGDIVDDLRPEHYAYTLCKALAKKYPCFYVAGNHEFRSGKVDEIKARLRQMDITVLQGGYARITIRTQELLIFGLDDPDAGADIFASQLRAVKKDSCLYKILLAHRPELIYEYKKNGFDLILAGHAHGGQWRIPGLINGVYAPNQGIFPKYAGGLYTLDNTCFIVNRGLAREKNPVPRIFNPPELNIIQLVPDNDKRE